MTRTLKDFAFTTRLCPKRHLSRVAEVCYWLMNKKTMHNSHTHVRQQFLKCLQGLLANQAKDELAPLTELTRIRT